MNNREQFFDLKVDLKGQESIYGEFELVELEEGNRIPYGLVPWRGFSIDTIGTNKRRKLVRLKTT